MSSTHSSESAHSHFRQSHRGFSCCGRGHWSGTNIAAMVLGFIVFAPLGFAVLLWSIAGRPIEELPGWLRDKWQQMFRGGTRASGDSENVVFNEYQQTQYDRIREIKEEVRRRAEAFRNFRFDAKRRRDQREFDEFMSTSPGQKTAED